MNNQQFVDICRPDIEELIRDFHRSKLERFTDKDAISKMRKKLKERAHMPQFMQGLYHVDAFAEAGVRNFEAASDEGKGGDIFEGVALIVARRSGHWDKVVDNTDNKAMGIDFELHPHADGLTIKIIEMKTSIVWGNSSQQESLRFRMAKAEKLLLMEYPDAYVSFHLGICASGKPSKSRISVKSNDIRVHYAEDCWAFLTGREGIMADIMRTIYRAQRNVYPKFEKAIIEARQHYTEEYKKAILELVPPGKEAEALPYIIGAIPCEDE